MTYAIFIWHAAFLAITMSMIDLNTVFPALITSLGGLIVARAFSMKSPAFPANYALLLTIGSAGLVIASAAFFYLKRQKGSHMIDYAPG